MESLIKKQSDSQPRSHTWTNPLPTLAADWRVERERGHGGGHCPKQKAGPRSRGSCSLRPQPLPSRPLRALGAWGGPSGAGRGAGRVTASGAAVRLVERQGEAPGEGRGLPPAAAEG